MDDSSISPIPWLLDGDVAVQYQTHRDLLDSPAEVAGALRARIAREGWGLRFLQARDPQTGLWGNGFYSPKWISTHYTLLDLKNIGLDPACPQYRQSAELLLGGMWPEHGLVRKDRYQDFCVSAMVLDLCCYAGVRSPRLEEIVDYLLGKRYPDGGWNCEWDHGDEHSSLHTTLTVLEAFRDYEAYGYRYRLEEIRASLPAAREFILKKRLFRSVHTGEVIDPRMLMLSYPCRWKFDILRCMDYFASVGKEWDPRMAEALDLILSKRRSNGRWPVQQKYVGKVHFDMEPTGDDSRWNTLRALRVLKRYRPELYEDYTGRA
jgi:hypothetical protein